jgi:phosphoglycolate phosphatase
MPPGVMNSTRQPDQAAMIRHILWDWNGTLLDDVDACVGAINRMLDPRRLPRIDTAGYRMIFDFPVKSYYERLGFDLGTEDWDAVAVEFHDHYNELARLAPLRGGIAEVLAAMREAAVPMSVLSACEGSILNRMLAERGIHDRFRHISGLDNLHAASKLENGRALLREIRLPPQDILLIGDTNHDHDVASAIGIRCVLLGGGHQHESRLRAPDIIHSPQALLPYLLALQED